MGYDPVAGAFQFDLSLIAIARTVIELSKKVLDHGSEDVPGIESESVQRKVLPCDALSV